MTDKRFACSVCGRQLTTLKRCTRCRRIYYCSRQCQIEDWPSHRSGCNPSGDQHPPPGGDDVDGVGGDEVKADQPFYNQHQVESEVKRTDYGLSQRNETVSPDTYLSIPEDLDADSDGAAVTDYQVDSDHLKHSDIWNDSDVKPTTAKIVFHHGNRQTDVQALISASCQQGQSAIDFQGAAERLKQRHLNPNRANSNIESNSSDKSDICHAEDIINSSHDEKHETTFTIMVKANKTKYKLELGESWPGERMMRHISSELQISIEKLKLIHKGKFISKNDIRTVAKPRALFQAIGEKSESEDGLDPSDIEIMMKQLSIERNVAIRALRKSGNVIDAILEVSNK